MVQLEKAFDFDIVSEVNCPKAIVVIGASTGGNMALCQVLPKFPVDFYASIAVVQYMRPGFTRLLADQLNGLSELPVTEAIDGQVLKSGSVIVTPGMHSLSLDKPDGGFSKQFAVNLTELDGSIDSTRKRIDHAMISAASQFGSKTIGVLLTGIGDDGREGMKAIRDAGGRTIVQDEASSIVFDMPRNAIEAGVVDEVLPLWSIADRIIEMVKEIA